MNLIYVLPFIGLFRGNIILIAAAVIPAFFLLRQIYKSDRLESEPPAMVGRLILMGIISTALASMMERLGYSILGIFFSSEESVLYRLILYFIIVGGSEELSKFVILDRQTWSSPYFNCKYDAIVYSTTVSLGFALWENIKYVLSYGLRTALLRAVTAVPGHACFGVFMGVWYGLAKRCEKRGDLETAKTCKRLAVIMPAFIHGCYDYIATLTSSTASTIWFVVFVGAMFVISYAVIKRMSKTDDYL